MPITVELNQVGPTTVEAHMRNHTVMVDRPEAKNGHDRGAMGGELLLAALGGCFSSNLLAAIGAREAPVEDVAIEVVGEPADAPARFSRITMTVRARCDDPALLEKLVTMSERGCIVANTLKGGVDLEISSEAISG